MINNDIQNNQNELGELKALLFEEEIEAFSKLEKKIETLQLELNDSEQIIRKITPLFDDVLLKKFEDKDERTVEIYAEHLAKIINKSTKKHLPELSKSLQSVISPAISKEIADNKDTMIDALYPIMGGMISKYVTQAIKEMMETINNKIEDGLSFDKYKRKVKSKISGVSETELLIEESIEAQISSLFVIHKESGLLIAEAHLEDKEIDDPHMVASMASAIKDFINDWVQSNDAQSEVQILSYGNATLYIESAGSVYVIAFLDAEPDYEQRTKINTFFAKIVKKYASFFQRFEGDDSAPEIESLSHQMSDYLNRQKNIGQKKKDKEGENPAKYFFYFLALSLLLYGLYRVDAWYDIYRLEHNVYEKTGEKVEIIKEDETFMLEGQVASMEHIYTIEEMVKKKTHSSVVNHLLVPMTTIDQQVKEVDSSKERSVNMLEERVLSLDDKYKEYVESLEKKILALNKALDTSNTHYTKLYNRAEEKIDILNKQKENVKNIIQVNERINLELDKALESDSYYNKEKHILDFSKLKLFMAAKSQYKQEAMDVMVKSFEIYLNILRQYKEYIGHISLQGHSDSSGNPIVNMALSQSRALAVKEYLSTLSSVKEAKMVKYLKAEGFGSLETIVVNGVEDRDASRRIEIGFTLKSEKIINKLKNVIND